MWEIASQKRPFADIESGMKVFEKVSNGERPDINLINIPEASRTYIDEYINIMTEAWNQEPSRRPEMISLCERLRNLYLKYKENGVEDESTLSMLNDSAEETKGTTTNGKSTLQNEEKDKSADELNLEKAKKYHDAKNYSAAWSIYKDLANNGNSEAK